VSKEIIWTDPQESLPPEGEYVLIWVQNCSWTSKSPTVFAKVAARFAEPWRRCAVWAEFGPGRYFDYEVHCWARIPPP
jgi:hypothetical protein